MKRPRVICHMMATVDGRILTERWNLSPAAGCQYEAVHALHHADAWLCGRQTFQGDFLEQARAATFSKGASVPRGDFVSPSQVFSAGQRRAKTPVYAIAVDASGKLRWPSNEMRGDQLVVLTTDRAPTGYLADLRAKSISYLRFGRSGINFPAALERLGRYFGLRKLMLEGGGRINGALLAAGVIDELSLLICPFADGTVGSPTVFDGEARSLAPRATALDLIAAKRRPGGVLWLRYAVKDRPR